MLQFLTRLLPARVPHTILLLPLFFIASITSHVYAATAMQDSVLPDHSLFTQVLRDHARDGAVDYKAIQKDQRFADYILQLEATDTTKIPGDQKLAFWLNAYNAFTIKIVIDRYPIKSILSKFAYAFKNSNFHKKHITINGERYSLNDIEHEIIRPMDEPRIHFALVCAAKSCPPLRAEAYDAARLDAQLDEQGRLFIRDSAKNSFDFGEKKAEISEIFNWFEDDFIAHTPSVLAYIATFLPEPQASQLAGQADQFEIKYKKYDWDLNDLAH